MKTNILRSAAFRLQRVRTPRTGGRSPVPIVALALSLAWLTGQAGEINLVANGGFESPDGVSTYTLFTKGSSIGGWTIEQGTVEIVAATYWQSAEGSQSLDLNGIIDQIGTISQDITTTPGQHYRIRFALAGNPEGGPDIKSLKLSWAGKELEELRFDITGHSTTNMGWEYHEYVVHAPGATNRLRFQSTSPGFCGPALDDISVTPLDPSASSALPPFPPSSAARSTPPPEPATAAQGESITTPLTPASVPATTPLAEAELALAFYPCLTVKGNVGQTYRIETAESVNAAEWRTIAAIVLPSSPFIWIDTLSPNASRRFYRAVLAP
jgi:choice-of-anchor C domain-containing protein